MVPVYVAESSSAHIRGTLGTAMQLAVSAGIVYVDALGLLGSWRWLTVACLAAALLWAVVLTAVPESPAYLLAVRRFDEAREALQVTIRDLNACVLKFYVIIPVLSIL